MFLYDVYKNGCLYSGICTARSALSSVIMIEVYDKLSSHLLVTKFVEGIFNKHPTHPKYDNVWDITILLTDYDNIPPNSELDFKYLCKKLVILILILGARREQALTSITVKNVVLGHYKVILLANKTMKHSAPNRPMKPFVYHSYKENEKLSKVNCMQFYLGERNCKVKNNFIHKF